MWNNCNAVATKEGVSLNQLISLALAEKISALVTEEYFAKRAKRGIWHGSFESPQDWRARHRDQIVRSDLGE